MQDGALKAVRDRQADAYASTALGNRTVLQLMADAELTSVDAQDDASSSLPVGAFTFAHESVDLRSAFDEFLEDYVGSAEHRERMMRSGVTNKEIDPIVGWRRRRS